MNDLFGHEAGDKLIIKSADSIRKVINNKVHGFRMGGDEFLMVAENVTRVGNRHHKKTLGGRACQT